jgi:peptidoglycan/LPS O-acetylase OafA/YrhL
MKIEYRPDIDGLRAVAVLLVILYHLGLMKVSGGYLGVDVFFVISGFLITSIIIRDIENNKFSLSYFYERRIKRILPALFTVMLTSLGISWFLLFPQSFGDFGASLAATAAFGSNIWFWKNSGYFEVEAELVPLLHTWSLAIEEQFYILFPLYLIIVCRYFKRFLIPLTILGFFISLSISIVALEHAKYAATFYLLPPRAWELMVGALLALISIPVLKNKSLTNIIGIIGLVMIIAPAFIYTPKTLFPGAAALFPCLGAALLIYSGKNAAGNFTHRILSLKPVVLIGKMSYSLYLWHWPLIVFYNYTSPEKLSTGPAIAILLLSFLLAFLSWKFIEQPCRKNTSWSRKRIFLTSGAISALIILAGLFIYYSKGVPNRFSKEIQILTHATIGKKIPDIKHLGFEGNSGILGDKAQAPTFIVWGDSHAKAATPALDSLARETDRQGFLLEDSGCIPATVDIPVMEPACNEFNQQVLTFIKKHPDIDRVILIARWSAYARRFESKEEKYQDQKLFADYIEGVFKFLQEQGKEIWFVTEVPMISIKRLPLYLGRAKYYGQDIHYEFPYAEHKERQEIITRPLMKLQSEYNVKTLSPHEGLCNQKVCQVIHDGRPLYTDDDHLSTYGSEYLTEQYRPLFRY